MPHGRTKRFTITNKKPLPKRSGFWLTILFSSSLSLLHGAGGDGAVHYLLVGAYGGYAHVVLGAALQLSEGTFSFRAEIAHPAILGQRRIVGVLVYVNFGALYRPYAGNHFARI